MRVVVNYRKGQKLKKIVLHPNFFERKITMSTVAETGREIYLKKFIFILVRDFPVVHYRLLL